MLQRVLIVDDAYFMRNLIRKALEEAGYEVVGEAKNGTEGVQKYFELNPDLITMDVNMPDISGIEATRRITKKDPEANILTISRTGDEQVKKAMSEAGSKAYLVKPFQPAFLLNKIDQIVKEIQEKESLAEKEIDLKGSEKSPTVIKEADEEDFFFGEMEFELENEPKEEKLVLIKNDEEQIEIPDLTDQDKETFALKRETIEKSDASLIEQVEVSNVAEEKSTPEHVEKTEKNTFIIEEEEPVEKKEIDSTFSDHSDSIESKEESSVSIEDKWRLRKEALEKEMRIDSEGIEPKYSTKKQNNQIKSKSLQKRDSENKSDNQDLLIRPPRGRFLKPDPEDDEYVDQEESFILSNSSKIGNVSSQDFQGKPSLIQRLKKWIGVD